MIRLNEYGNEIIANQRTTLSDEDFLSRMEGSLAARGAELAKDMAMQMIWKITQGHARSMYRCV